MNKYTQNNKESQKIYTRHFKKIVAHTSQIVLKKRNLLSNYCYKSNIILLRNQVKNITTTATIKKNGKIEQYP